MRSNLILGLCSGILAAALGTGCNGTQPARPQATAVAAGKIAPSLTAAALQLENDSSHPPLLTGLVRSDAAGNIQVYVHVTNTSSKTLAALGQRGLKNMLASPALGIVQGWVNPRKLAILAELSVVTRITPPRYAIPR